MLSWERDPAGWAAWVEQQDAQRERRAGRLRVAVIVAVGFAAAVWLTGCESPTAPRACTDPASRTPCVLTPPRWPLNPPDSI
jgi:hypothetical protein